MRTVAQVIGYVWLAWMAYVILGTVLLSLAVTSGFSSGDGLGPKLVMEELINLILAMPGVLLVLWGRRRRTGEEVTPTGEAAHQTEGRSMAGAKADYDSPATISDD